MIHDCGGDGPPILALHGLMGRGTTWRAHLPWLRQLGHVWTLDARFHRGITAPEYTESPADTSTARFVADVVSALDILATTSGAPVWVIGHSMGGLHGWIAAAERPDLVSRLVVEDMGADFRGHTTANWQPWFRDWPQRFASLGEATDLAGPVAGRYFYDSYDVAADGQRVLHGDIPTWQHIADEWGRRAFWTEWEALQVPTLLVVAAQSVVPAGQAQQMADRNPRVTLTQVPDSMHLIHDSQAREFARLVTEFA